MAAAPTFPLCAELSVYTLIFSIALVSARLDSFLLGGMSICVSHEPLLLGCIRTGGIFSKSVELILKMFVRVLMGERCLFMHPLVLLLTNECNGCSCGRVAIHEIRLKHAFLTLSSIGNNAACVSRESVGEVLKPPITARDPALCTVTSFLMVLTEPFFLPFADFPCVGVHPMSMP